MALNKALINYLGEEI